MTPHEIAAGLRSRCAYAFEEDPAVEVGKVRKFHGAEDAWCFQVYVLKEDGSHGLMIDRVSTVLVSPATIEVHGPDEQAIGRMLKEPML